jgi:lipoate-protein ligase B
LKILISILQLGTVDYATALSLQQQLVGLRKEEKIGDVLLLLEHNPVITLGRNAKATNIVASPELLAQRGVELFECDRGGDVTLHAPGQLVGYPIFDLRGYANGAADTSSAVPQTQSKTSSLRKHLGAVDFVRRLEEVLIRACADFALETKRIPGLTGVWTNAGAAAAHVETAASAVQRSEASAPAPDREAPNREGHDFSRAVNPRDGAPASAAEVLSPLPAKAAPEAKLAAIGIHISHFVTSHGFALNVNTDLTYFNLIIPCGITTKPVTSMQQELGKPIDQNAVAESISRNFGKVFSSQILWLDTLDALLGRTVGVPMKPPTELRQLHREDDTTWA